MLASCREAALRSILVFHSALGFAVFGHVPHRLGDVGANGGTVSLHRCGLRDHVVLKRFGPSRQRGKLRMERLSGEHLETRAWYFLVSVIAAYTAQQDDHGTKRMM